MIGDVGCPIFDADVWKDLDSNPSVAAYHLARHFVSKHQSVNPSKRNGCFVEAFHIFMFFCTDNGIARLLPKLPEIGDNSETNINSIVGFFQQTIAVLTPAMVARNTQTEVEAAIELAKKRYAEISATTFAYEISEQDYDQLQSLIDKMRGLLHNSALFDEVGRSALLRRLEALQRELNRRMVSFDAFILF